MKQGEQSTRLGRLSRRNTIRGFAILSCLFACVVLFWGIVWLQTGELGSATGFSVGATAVGFAVYDIDKQFVPMDINGNYDYHAYGGVRHMLTREKLQTFRQTGYYDLWILHIVIYSM